MFRFINSLLAIASAALIQNTNLLEFWTIKPNISLIFVIIFGSLEKNFLGRLILIFTAASILKFYSGIEIQNILFIITAFGTLLLVSYLPWKKSVNILMAILIGTVTMDLINFELAVAIKELAYNLSIGAITLIIIGLFEKKKSHADQEI